MHRDLVERNFGARQQADRDTWLADSSKAASDGVPEVGRHQPIIDLGRPVRYEVQTVVTHGQVSSSCESPNHPSYCEAP
jgi:hypothetical protein